MIQNVVISKHINKTKTTPSKGNIKDVPIKRAIILPIIIPSKTPINPPNCPIIIVSVKNCCLIFTEIAPNDFLIPTFSYSLVNGYQHNIHQANNKT
ncbi:MAG: hypothetical protein N3A01_08630 [Bacteroidales bacterium]|nr:hypothetical protein [Bacteroidales bacterium]